MTDITSLRPSTQVRYNMTNDEPRDLAAILAERLFQMPADVFQIPPEQIARIAFMPDESADVPPSQGYGGLNRQTFAAWLRNELESIQSAGSQARSLQESLPDEVPARAISL